MPQITVSNIKSLQEISYLSSGEEYIEYLYEAYLQDPRSLPIDWKNYFDAINAAEGKSDVSHEAIREHFLSLALHSKKAAMVSNTPASSDVEHERKQAKVKELVYAYRELGHLHANLDPLNLTSQPIVPELELSYYGLDLKANGEEIFSPDHFGDGNPLSLSALIESLKKVYCQSIGAEYLHIMNQHEVHWIQSRLENPSVKKQINPKVQERILACLTAAEGLEKYLGTKYTGQKRFSLEGGDSLIVLLDKLIQYAGYQNMAEIVIGMAHRGRLNVLVNILGKSPKELFDAFEGKAQSQSHSGDVKYHLGFSSDVATEGSPVHLALAFNPSHLEIVSPVVEGSVRARQQRRTPDEKNKIMAVQIHGDAAFAGQGVVMETFSLSQTEGFHTFGTVHIIVNNQVGFTTDPMESRSTYYCTDLAKMIQAPIFHVNADDPEAVWFVTQIALEYRMQFKKDVVIDLICYRRHGHNEADEPSATQPVMYKKIRAQPTARQIYADKLTQLQIISREKASQMVDEYRSALDEAKNWLVPLKTANEDYPYTIDWTPYLHVKERTEMLESFETGFDLDTLKKLGSQINTVPHGMTLQPQVAKIIDDNRKMANGDVPLNWGFAENLAYASLLSEKFSIRLSGQDSARGTFAHRHAVWHDYQTGKLYTPLQQISPEFDVVDSILSESAVLGFEYGYSTSTPNALVLWEAQFGDFANGAQVVIDQFISSGEQKWERLSGITMLLPHGYEGMGPEHSSARLERYLQLCAQDNMRVCVPTTPAQIFHLLRRQVIQKIRKPLIVMTPKSLLRHKLAVSNLEELSHGAFQAVIMDASKEKQNKKMKRVILCSGKVYYDLLDARESQKITDTVLIRIEQLYPFPEKTIKTLLQKDYANVQNIIWCQEEPQNQGAWSFIKPYLDACLGHNQQLSYSGREPAASTASGSAKRHLEEQRQLVQQAFTLFVKESSNDR